MSERKDEIDNRPSLRDRLLVIIGEAQYGIDHTSNGPARRSNAFRQLCIVKDMLQKLAGPAIDNPYVPDAPRPAS